MSTLDDPFDDLVRRQLAHRAAHPVPTGLVEEIVAAVDREPDRSRLASRVAWRAPRVLSAAAAVALVVIVAASVVALAPSLGPATSAPLGAGYPARRPLTTAELEQLMVFGNPPLNETLVVDTTIEVDPLLCPRNVYPTLGRIAGIEPEMCVFGSTVADVRPPAKTLRGVFALRYVAPGMLLYAGQITAPASGGYAFRVADSWPEGGQTFLVDGWLGASELLASCAAAPTWVDPLVGATSACPYSTWMADVDPGSRNPLDGGANPIPVREVGAGGIYGFGRSSFTPGLPALDAPLVKAVHAMYAVRQVTGPCASPASGTCTEWRVLGKVDPVLIPAPRPSQIPSASPTPGRPVEVVPLLPQPLAAGDLLGLVMTGKLPAGMIVAVKAEMAPADGLCPGDNEKDGVLMGRMAAVDPPICLYGATQLISPDRPYLLLTSLGGTHFRVTATVAPGPSGAAYTADEAWPADDRFLVRATLGSPQACDGPGASGTICRATLASAPGNRGRLVDVPRYTPDPTNPSPSVAGTFLVAGNGGSWTVLARLSDVPADALPAANGPSGAVPVSPQPTLAASPVPWAPAGLIGPGNRALTADELVAAVIADPGHLNGRVAIAKGPFPGGVGCPGPGTEGCAIMESLIGDERVWALRVSSVGFDLIAPLSMSDGTPVSSLASVAAATTSAEQLFVLDARLNPQLTVDCHAGCSPFLVSPDGVNRLYVQLEAGRFVNPVLSVSPAPGLYVVRIPSPAGCTGAKCQAEIVARVEAVQP